MNPGGPMMYSLLYYLIPFGSTLLTLRKKPTEWQ
jgi:hypothetical protein